jgi:signal transduction histidine kinase
LSNEWRQVAQAANLSLDVVIEQRGLFVLGDERRLRWALGNLVDNAIKYTPPGGAVTLEIRGEVNGMAHLRLRDNGVGIHIDELPHMFVRFFRGEPVTKEGRAIHVPGTGQGLSITKQIIEMHGGNIRLKSTQWVGTAAYVALPLTSPVSLEIPRLYNLDDADSETIQLRDLDSATVRIDSEDQQR